MTKKAEIFDLNIGIGASLFYQETWDQVTV